MLSALEEALLYTIEIQQQLIDARDLIIKELEQKIKRKKRHQKGSGCRKML